MKSRNTSFLPSFLICFFLLSMMSNWATASCTTCTGVDGVPYCTGGNVAELCRTVGDGCVFSGSRNCGGHGCFLATTPVMTNAGLVPIAALHAGDIVLGRDDSGRLIEDKVKRTYKSVSYQGYYLINGNLGVTGEHPFSVRGEWVLAKDLRIGDMLSTPGGSFTLIKSIKRINRGVRVYNIDTLRSNTFFAGGMLVHNKNGDIQG